MCVVPYPSGDVKAIRAIDEGSEITVCYINPLPPKNVRQERLQTGGYRFTCVCDACESSASAFSDLRRLKVAEVCSAANSGGSDALCEIRECLLALQLLEDERLAIPAFHSRLYQRLQAAYAKRASLIAKVDRLGAGVEYKEAAFFGRKGLEIGSIAGHTPEFLKMVEQLTLAHEASYRASLI